MQWDQPEKPAELAEQRIIKAILDGVFPINSSLPSERELSTRIGVTRPTLREALQRLSRDGWIEIHQGKQTRVRDIWSEGNMNVLSSISRFPEHLSQNFVENLLQIRYLLCPTYSFMAFKNNPEIVIHFLSSIPEFSDSPEIYSEYDFNLHLKLTQASGNPIFTLILNGFKELFTQKAIIYFHDERARIYSYNFYKELQKAFVDQKSETVYSLTEKVMKDSISFWKNAS
ncbi:MAG: fatty acid metabolism transcriptional regulator FadR [Chloroflexi bacterium HGW-Chloroflexi-2]|jgi:GntR family negative regulator for fad regulon and positive regulator of fabA|nr:MAG: fatty acid metabolism transcriptional regulator FadR [Chloroflexi bacterium HGW-Chloroflexi-2]